MPGPLPPPLASQLLSGMAARAGNASSCSCCCCWDSGDTGGTSCQVKGPSRGVLLLPLGALLPLVVRWMAGRLYFLRSPSLRLSCLLCGLLPPSMANPLAPARPPPPPPPLPAAPAPLGSSPGSRGAGGGRFSLSQRPTRRMISVAVAANSAGVSSSPVASLTAARTQASPPSSTTSPSSSITNRASPFPCPSCCGCSGSCPAAAAAAPPSPPAARPPFAIPSTCGSCRPTCPALLSLRQSRLPKLGALLTTALLVLLPAWALDCRAASCAASLHINSSSALVGAWPSTTCTRHGGAGGASSGTRAWEQAPLPLELLLPGVGWWVGGPREQPDCPHLGLVAHHHRQVSSDPRHIALLLLQPAELDEEHCMRQAEETVGQG